MTGGFLSDPSTIIKIGDKLKVKISGFNDNHQIKLSSPEFKAAHPGQPREEGSDNRSQFNNQRPQFNKFNPDFRKRPR
jgi:predicted RNA-binding protein with RPS1 domain